MNLNSCKVVLALFLLAGAQQAWAQADVEVGTNAGETIASSATVDYKVNSIDQTQAAATGGTLIVDRKVDLLVTSLGTASTTATPGSSTDLAGGLTAIPFTVYNGTNATMDLVLEAGSTTVDPWGGTVSGANPPTTFHLYLDVNGDGVLDAGDTAIADDGNGIYFLDEVPEGHTTKVLVAADIPATAVNGEILPISLQATAYDGGAAGLGAESVATSGGDTAAEDTVFADAAGVIDAARDGKHSDSDSYKVESAEVTVTKTSWVIDDPINNTTDPKAIPGATIRYCITVANGGSTDADNVVISDPIDVAKVDYKAGTLYAGEDVDCSSSTPPTLGSGYKLVGDETTTTATATTGGATGDYSQTTTNAVTTNVGTIAGAAKKTTIFDVTIKSN